MTDSMAPRAAFLAKLSEPDAGRWAAVDDLADRLRVVYATARAAWPGIEVPAEVFAAHLAARLPGDLPPPDGLDALNPVDLYLACAGTTGVTGAGEAFVARYADGMARALLRLDAPDALRADTVQAVLQRLLVGDGAPPHIARYSGRGELGAWARVVTVRAARDALRRTRKEVPLDDAAVLERAGSADDPELAWLKTRYREAFAQSARAALGALTPRDRTLLRYHYVEGLGVDPLGAIYQVHRATAARWLGRARDALLAATRAELVERLHVDRTELESIVRLLGSQLHVTLPGLME